MKVKKNRNWFTRTKIGFLITLLLLGIFNYPGFVPWTSASETAIDTAVDLNSSWHSSSGTNTVFISDTTGYVFYPDDSDNGCGYKKTTNSGSTWSAITYIDDVHSDCHGISIWYDRWTPGDTTGNYIHIAWVQDSVNGIFYNRIDTASSDTLWINKSSPMDISGSTTPDINGESSASVTKGTDGDLYIGMPDDVDGAVFKCTGTCNSSGNWPEAASGTNPFTLIDERAVLLPQAGGNIMAIQHDRSADDIESKIYTDSSNTWAGSWTDIDSDATDVTNPWYISFSAVVDPITYDVYLAYIHWATDDIRTALYSGGTWASKGQVVDNNWANTTQVSLAFNQNNGDVYVAYAYDEGGGDQFAVYFQKSTNKMQSWTNELAPINASQDNIHGVHLNYLSNERIYLTWSEETDNSIYGDTIADLSPTTVEQAAYRVYDGANTTGSGWWNSSWLNRKKITIDNSSSTENLTNFAVRVSLSASNIDYGKTKDAGEDIRFVDSDNSTVLKHEIEQWVEAGTSEVWVKVPQIDANSAGDYIWMYYNNTGASDGQDAQNVWDSATKAVYHMNFSPAPAGGGAGCDGGTKELCDSTSNNNDGDANNMASGALTTGSPCINRCWDFDGTNDSAVVPDHSSLDITDTVTLSGWGTYTSNGSFWRTLMAKEESCGCESYGLQVTEDPELVFAAHDGSYWEERSPNNLTSGESYFFAATFTDVGASGEVCIYQNGSQTFCTTQSNDIVTNNDGLRVGLSGSSDEDWAGKMDELRVVNGIRSPEWLEAEYLTGTNRYLNYGSEETYVNASLSALAATNTAAMAAPATDPFRLRLLMHFGGDGLRTGSTSYKLQYAPKSGTCDTGFSGETYVDVGTGDIKFHDIASPTDAAQIGSVSGDPTHSSDTIVPQSVEEGNNFTNAQRIASGHDALWDFSLVDTSHTSGQDYCFRVVTSGGFTINTYTQIPELQQPSVGGAMRHGNYFNGNGVEEGSVW